MQLALRMGRPDVDRFMRAMSSSQLVEWERFLMLESGQGTRYVSESEFRAQFGARVVKKKRS